jgi:ribosomal RNA-processing protein 7
MSKSTTASPLIKGYLPLRVKLPERGETFLFLKQHNGARFQQHKQTTEETAATSSANNKKSSSSSTSTMFVSNVPFVANVNSRVLLRAIFGQYGTIQQVVVVRNPRHAKHQEQAHGILRDDAADNVDAIQTWKDLVQQSNNLFPIHERHDEGKFAHVTFSTPKEMEKVLKSLRRLNSEKGLELSQHQLEDLIEQTTMLEDSSSMDENEQQDTKSTTRVQKIAERYRQRVIPREKLLEYCNHVMEQFEQNELEADEATKEANAEVDEDGFIKVSYKNTASATAGSKRELETDAALLEEDEGGRRRNKRSRNKKQKASGSSELQDFYRFQRRDTRKKGLQDLRQRFEEDLAAVKKIKEEKKYRPFEE